ncbi:MAG: Uma2 family endonuclease [Acidobacteria bacterium]|nr:Uma2 family endonuclease [Acidobacteriota bacterium]
MDDYLSRGVQLVWVVDPDKKIVTIYRRLSAPISVGIDENLDDGEVLPGFTCPIRRIFE